MYLCTIVPFHFQAKDFAIEQINATGTQQQPIATEVVKKKSDTKSSLAKENEKSDAA